MFRGQYYEIFLTQIIEDKQFWLGLSVSTPPKSQN